ncbi:MAG: efflux RND transporter permease subunit [Ignavibacteriales bacterium]|nr:efflux RND transporter permease subunit [Ignavibacteriales bacterium]
MSGPAMGAQQSAVSTISGMGTNGQSMNMSASSRQNSQSTTPARPVDESTRRASGFNPKYAFIPLAQLADIRQSPGPPMINSENSLLRSIVFLNVRGRDMGSFVNDAKEALTKNLSLPPGYYVSWSGQYENQIRAKKRLEILIPVVFLIIFVMLYFTFKSFLEATMVMLSVPFALIGGVYLIYFLGYNFSVAVWVGFIALYGVAVETGVVMVIYLHEALDKYLRKGSVTNETIIHATVEGAVLRLRPKIMTVATNLIGLMPIMWSTGTGSDVMKPIAAPMIGGIITSAIHVLLVTPVIFSMMKEAALKRGTLKVSGMKQ